jgi:hypothetical protein
MVLILPKQFLSRTTANAFYLSPDMHCIFLVIGLSDFLAFKPNLPSQGQS